MKFEDLIAWQKARELTNAAYRMGRTTRLNKDFSLRDQLQRAAVSSMTNLAEGFDRSHLAEKIQFWNVAKGSAGEVKSLLYVVSDNEIAPPGTVQSAQSLASEVSALTQGLINSLSKSKRSRRSDAPSDS